MKFTVLGASGFIGSHLVEHLLKQGHECYAPAKNDPAIYSRPLGHVIYCIGLTADYRNKPFETVRAHVGALADVLEKCSFESLLYLSSTRVYATSGHGHEGGYLQSAPELASDLYNLSKLTGEALCFASANPAVRVVRLSNVIGDRGESENFISSVLREATGQGHVELNTSLQSSKDYISITDVVEVLPKVAAGGKQRLYNIASGVNTDNRTVMEKIAAITGCTFSVSDDAREIIFPVIDIQRVKREFGFNPAPVLECLELPGNMK
jgi:nucleoside-diphosphate-sugar epimerase